MSPSYRVQHYNGPMPSLFAELPSSSQEVFETLCQAPGVRIERIVSQGQASASGFWYEQPQAEWVLLVRGRATLSLLDPEEVVELAAGDYLLLTPRRRHRVEETSADAIWLAVHLTGQAHQ
ncbi:MAG TPA: cupin domain-containing protein [Polyangiaceae bacterium]|nr:cupin domain-containing protein [Polyangiaceae bacterium]